MFALSFAGERYEYRLMSATFKNVPTNIMTGFLGTGKTSAIQHLLKYKPEHERWAILVNEFGSVGIDGTLYQNKHKEEGGVFVRTVPGGCMCCVSGLPMQIALNVLLKLSNPHRLFIEPSGLGHPVEVVALLKSKYYSEVLDIQKIFTLIDPQQYLQSKYFEHPTYQQQLEIADAVIVNKTDVCSVEQLDAFKNKFNLNALDGKDIHYSQFGRIDPNMLMGATGFESQQDVIMRTSDEPISEELPPAPPIPSDTGYVMKSRSDEGFECVSWRYRSEFVFSKDKLLAWFKEIRAERVKGVVKTDAGIIGLNIQSDDIEIIPFDTCNESTIEIIANSQNKDWDATLAACVIEGMQRSNNRKLEALA